MTPEEFKNKMEEIFKDAWDHESTHSEADNLICKLLRELGYGDGVKIFEEATKW